MTVYYSPSESSVSISSPGGANPYTVSAAGTQFRSFLQPGDFLAGAVAGANFSYGVASVIADTSAILTVSTGTYGATSTYSAGLTSVVPPAVIPIPAIVPSLPALFCDATTSNVQVEAAGYNSAGDGGGGAFFWDPNAVASISDLLLASPGFGYSTTPTGSPYQLTITPINSGAGGLASAYVTGAVNSVNLTDPGYGFSAVPTVAIGAGSTTSAATAYAVLQVASIAVLTAGSNYTSAVSVLVDPPGSAGITAYPPTVSVTSNGLPVAFGGSITAILVSTGTSNGGGQGYTGIPNVSISDVSGTGATASAYLSIVGIPVNDTGADYGYATASPPAVAITPASGATATAVVSGYVSDVVLKLHGSQYNSGASVTMPTAAGTPASAATFVPVMAADGGTAFFPSVGAAGGWRRIPS